VADSWWWLAAEALPARFSTVGGHADAGSRRYGLIRGGRRWWCGLVVIFGLNRVPGGSVNKSQTWSNWLNPVKSETRRWRKTRDAKASPTTCPDRETSTESVRSVREREPYTERYKVYLVFVCIVTNN
jgi:hypothetical protein